MSAVTPVTETVFGQEVLQAEGLVLLVFKADWAGPSKALMEKLETYAAGNPALKIVSVDVDSEPKLSGEFGIKSVPVLVTMHGGKTLFGVTGNQPPEVLDKLVRESLGAAGLPPLGKIPHGGFPAIAQADIATGQPVSVMRPLKLGKPRKTLFPRGLFS